jgi:hypothetical protein
MCIVPTMLFPSRIPKAPIAGLLLTPDRAHSFLAATLVLIPILKDQIHSIAHLNRTHPDFIARLRAIQERQLRFQNKISEVVKATKSSTELWADELMDGQAAILRKVRQCNRQSAAAELGWKVAACQYWPLILDSYKILLPNFVRLFNEVDEALATAEVWVPTKTQYNRRMSLAWFTAAAPVQPVGRTSFDDEVQAQWIYAWEQPDKVCKGVEFKVSLTSDRKRSVGKFKKTKTKSKGKRVVAASQRVEYEQDGMCEDPNQSQEVLYRLEVPPPMPL